MNTTPRTLEEQFFANAFGPDGWVVPTEFAEKLEKELNEANDAISSYEEAHLTDTTLIGFLEDRVKELRNELSEIRKMSENFKRPECDIDCICVDGVWYEQYDGVLHPVGIFNAQQEEIDALRIHIEVFQTERSKEQEEIERLRSALEDANYRIKLILDEADNQKDLTKDSTKQTLTGGFGWVQGA